ncbi:MAG: glutathione S-transferase N-terminal domain-containing protein, partial [Gammaproteobacteria bacterium]|nr:glutathione S-transferase N-terminal domain-containing protein [Gammaproteobacteria bacterium]
IRYINPDNPPAALLEENPEASTPTLVDRDLVLKNSKIIMEYLDERYPHPPLYPMDPVSRARARMAAYQIETDWYSLYTKITEASERQAQAARKALRESIVEAESLFQDFPFFLSQEFSMIDCSLAPLLWRLPYLGVSLPTKKTDSITAYCDRMFKRESFQDSLTDEDRDLVDQSSRK